MILEDVFITTATIGLLTAFLNLVGASIYDVREVKKERQLRRHPHSRQYRRRPVVTVIVMAHNSCAVIERALGAITASSYRKLEIIVIDNASSDNTRQAVRRFKTDHPKRSVRLVARRTADTNLDIIIANAKKYAQGEVILRLDAGSVIDKHAVATIVQRYNMEPELTVITLNRRILSQASMLGLFQKYQELLQQGPQKLMSVAGSAYELPTAAMAYRRDALISKQVDSTWQQAYYAGNAVIHNESVSSLYSLIRQQYQRQVSGVQAARQRRRLFFRSNGRSRLLAWVYLPLVGCSAVVSLFVPLLASYFIYMAVGLHEPAFLILSWVVVSLLLLTAVWSDTRLKAAQKISYSFFIPVTYALLYALSFVRIFTAVRAVLSPKKFWQPAV